MTDSTLNDRSPRYPAPTVLYPDWERIGQHLPTPLTSFIGREQEVVAAASLLRRPNTRLVTLTGPGGVGKTRLAIRAVTDAAEAFPDGIWFVPLAPVRNPALIGSTIAGALGVQETHNRPIVESISVFLGGRHVLLVLDNFEHVLEAGPTVIDLLAACPALTVLITSRSVLSVSGEHAFRVPPLAVVDPEHLPGLEHLQETEAIRLFVERATAADADFALTTANASAVATLCARLDGVPLAIELAAARMRSLSPQALLRRLDQRLGLLTGGARDQPERLQTMRDAIAWSYDLLEPEEQALFRRLASFVGGCTIEAVEAVATAVSALALDIITSVASLVDKSLLRPETGPDGEPRYLLLETVREFGLEHLVASGEAAPTRQAHAEWYLTLAEESAPWTWGGSKQKLWLDRLEVELPNLRAALAWFDQSGNGEAVAHLAAALEGYWHVRSRRAEGRAWLERALALGVATDWTRAKALLSLGTLEHHFPGNQRVTEVLGQCLVLSRQLGDSQGTVCALIMLGICASSEGDPVRATPLLTEAGALAAEIGDRDLEAWAKLQLGSIALLQGGPEVSELLVEEAVNRFRCQDNASGVASALLVLGWAATDRRDFATAAARYAEGIPLWQELGTQEALVDVLTGVAALAGATGHLERGVKILAAAEVLKETIGYVLAAPERARYDGTKAALQTKLGEGAFDAAWIAGLATPADQATLEAQTLLADFCEMRSSCVAPLAPPGDGLTRREREVLRLLADGRSDREIAAALFISPKTVGSHVSNLLGKLGVPSRAAAVAYVHRHGFV
jgi:predicted ATPase/DNA-binding CsgD family transcriptional regulator